MDLSKFDAIVATLGGMEAMTLLPVHVWRTQIDELIEASSVPIFIVGVAPISSIIRMPRLLGYLVTPHGRRLNDAAEAACAAAPHATFVPFFPATGDVVGSAGRSTYAEWSELIAPSVALTLRYRPIGPHPLDHLQESARESARQAALDALQLDEARDDYELQRIVETVRDLFGTMGAGLNIVDRARQWALTNVGMGKADIPREEAFCNQTIARDGLFVVNDATAHPDEPWAQHDSIRFYAGYPIESPEGHRIGALCIVDSHPREFAEADRVLLRDLALHTQAILWQRVSQ